MSDELRRITRKELDEVMWKVYVPGKKSCDISFALTEQKELLRENVRAKPEHLIMVIELLESIAGKEGTKVDFYKDEKGDTWLTFVFEVGGENDEKTEGVHSKGQA